MFDDSIADSNALVADIYLDGVHPGNAGRAQSDGSFVPRAFDEPFDLLFALVAERAPWKLILWAAFFEEIEHKILLLPTE